MTLSLPVITSTSLTVYPLMMPFCWPADGGLQPIESADELNKVTSIDTGGAVGTAKKEKCSYADTITLITILRHLQREYGAEWSLSNCDCSHQERIVVKGVKVVKGVLSSLGHNLVLVSSFNFSYIDHIARENPIELVIVCGLPH